MWATRERKGKYRRTNYRLVINVDVQAVAGNCRHKSVRGNATTNAATSRINRTAITANTTTITAINTKTADARDTRNFRGRAFRATGCFPASYRRSRSRLPCLRFSVCFARCRPHDQETLLLEKGVVIKSVGERTTKPQSHNGLRDELLYRDASEFRGRLIPGK